MEEDDSVDDYTYVSRCFSRKFLAMFKPFNNVGFPKPNPKEIAYLSMHKGLLT